MKLDYSLTSPEERKALVEQIIEEQGDDISSSYLEILADYLVTCMEKEEKKQKMILTDNRMATIKKRECSFDGLVSELENGEDGIYNLIIDDNKHCIFKPKISITQHDLDTIPCLQQLRDTILVWEGALKRASGKDAYIIKRALIEMRKEQYIIKQAYQKPIIFKKIQRRTPFSTKLEDLSFMRLVDDGPHSQDEPIPKGCSLMDPNIVSVILCNYSRLKEDSYEDFEGDTWYLIQTFEELVDKALVDYPYYMRLVECKIDGMQNTQIQDMLEKEFGIKHSPEYISSLWRKKIPKIIATAAVEQFVIGDYRKNKKPFKKCSKCGQIKPAHQAFFSKNNTSKDQLYSICKACRNKKPGSTPDKKEANK